MSQFHHNLIFSNEACQFLFQSLLNLLSKRIKTTELNDFWLCQQYETPWCQTCLFLMSGIECTFFADSTSCLSNSYYRKRVTFWFLLWFYLVCSLDCMVKIRLSWRFFHKYSTSETHSSKHYWSCVLLSRETRQGMLVIIILYQFGRASSIVPCFSIDEFFSSVISFSFVFPRPQ